MTQNPALIGKSPEIHRVRKAIALLAGRSDHVLILGETGSGRTQVAESIYSGGKNKDKTLHTILCGTITENTNPEIAFSQSRPDTTVFNTVYLDSIEKLPLIHQKYFHSLLTAHKIRAIASAEPDLLQRMRSNQFDAELYHALNEFQIILPALRERKQDIPFIFDHFLEEFCREFNRLAPSIPGIIIDAILQYDWPGNVTELKNCVRNLAMMSPQGTLSPEFLPFRVQPDPLECLADLDLPSASARVEKFLIRRSLARCDDNQSKAARALKISEAALRYKMKKYGFPSAR